jgi:hypothetical protein
MQRHIRTRNNDQRRCQNFYSSQELLKSGPNNVLFKIPRYEDPSASLNWLFSSRTAPKHRY